MVKIYKNNYMPDYFTSNVEVVYCYTVYFHEGNLLNKYGFYKGLKHKDFANKKEAIKFYKKYILNFPKPFIVRSIVGRYIFRSDIPVEKVYKSR